MSSIELPKSLSESGIQRVAELEAVIVAFIEADTDFLTDIKSVVRKHN